MISRRHRITVRTSWVNIYCMPSNVRDFLLDALVMIDSRSIIRKMAIMDHTVVIGWVDGEVLS